MQFYSGFSLKNESFLFAKYIKKSHYCVSGFSYGSIKAFEYVEQELQNSRRIDTLQLFSPAFFQTKEKKFKRLQLMVYKKDKEKYLKNFIDLCFKPYNKKIIEQGDSNYEQLENLLTYVWCIDELKKIASSGVTIEIYLGGKDAIIDVESAREFFLDVATVTYIKDANHFLQIN